MSSLIIVEDKNSDMTDHRFIMEEFPNWKFYILNALDDYRVQIVTKIRENEIHFLIYEKILDHDAALVLANLQQQYPLLNVIYYNALLKDGEFAKLFESGISHCIVGESREKNLVDTLNQLWDSHWKRIPVHIIEKSPSQLTSRAARILLMIEKRPLRECNTYHLARSLSISESHFRKEFKRYFGINFREFKNRLFAHYESVLLFEKKLKPGHVFEILDYKNISAFSRSFKMRHGHSWQTMIRDQN